MIILNKEKEKSSKGGMYMLEEKIQRKREELNESIENKKKYEDVYKLSVELDDLISEFYREAEEKQKKKTFFGRKNNRKILYIV